MGYSRPARDFRTVQWEHAAFLSRDARLLEGHLTPSPNLDPGLVRESSCPGWGWKGFVDEEATQYRADRGLASAG